MRGPGLLLVAAVSGPVPSPVPPAGLPAGNSSDLGQGLLDGERVCGSESGHRIRGRLLATAVPPATAEKVGGAAAKATSKDGCSCGAIPKSHTKSTIIGGNAKLTSSSTTAKSG